MANQKEIRGGGVSATSQGGLVAMGGGGAGGAINFTDHGGLVLTDARLVLIFWGTSWSGTPAVSTTAVINAVTSIVTGPYMNLLHQYRNINHATIQSTVTVTTAVGSSAADPPNPFADSDVSTLISDLISAGTVPGPASDPQLLYLVFMPQGTGSTGGFIGEHTYFSVAGTNCHYGWVMNSGALNSVTSIFSHELVESVTDPEGSSITGDAGSCTQGGWCEIGDVCYSNLTINGVTVQRYWSQADLTCVPTKDWKDAKDTKEVKEAKEFKDLKDHKFELKEHKEPKEFKDLKDHKPEHKEHKEHKEPKEIKDIKDHKFEVKEHKEPKEIPDKVIKSELKEYKEPKEIYEGSPFTPQGDPAELRSRIEEIAQRLGRLEQAIATGRAFIRPAERPPVGEQVLKQADEPRSAADTKGRSGKSRS